MKLTKSTKSIICQSLLGIVFVIQIVMLGSGCMEQLPNGTFKAPSYFCKITYEGHIYVYSGNQGGMEHDPNCPCFFKHDSNTCMVCNHLNSIDESCDKLIKSLEQQMSLEQIEKPEVITQVSTNTVVMTNRFIMVNGKKVVLPDVK